MSDDFTFPGLDDDDRARPIKPSGLRPADNTEIPDLGVEPRRRSNPHLNELLAQAATVTNHANVLDTASPKVKGQVSKSISTLNDALLGASHSIRGRKKGSSPELSLKHLGTALGSISEIAGAIAAHRPNSVSHHESQAALTGFIAAHNNLIKSLAQHGR